MINLSNYLLTLAFGVAVFGAVACSDDSSSSAAADDGKNDSFSWSDLQVFDGKADLPSCDKFEGVAAQVFDEKGFFVCSNNEWEQIGVSVPAYEKLPKCEAAMNDFCVYIEENEKIEASYICDEGEWVKGIQMDGVSLCLKGDENSITPNRSNFLSEARKKMIEDAKKKFEDELDEILKEYEENPDESSKEKIENLKKMIDELEISDDEFNERLNSLMNNKNLLASESELDLKKIFDEIRNPVEDVIEKEIEEILKNPLVENRNNLIKKEIEEILKNPLVENRNNPIENAAKKEIEDARKKRYENVMKERIENVLKNLETALENMVQEIANKEFDRETKEELESEVKELESKFECVKEKIKNEIDRFVSVKLTLENKVQEMANEELDGEAKEKLEAEVKELESEIDSVEEGIRNEMRNVEEGIRNIDAEIKRIERRIAERNWIREYLAPNLSTSFENRFQEYPAHNLSTSSEKLQSAESTYRDADMAKEMTEFVKNNILFQAATAMLAQANQRNQGVLSLLQ